MTRKATTPSGDLSCIVPLLDSEQAPPSVRGAYQIDQEREGRVRHLTRAVAASPVTWQTTARTLHMFVTLKCVDARTCALLCLYTSLLNGCRYCIDDAAGAAFEHGVTLAEMLALPAFSTAPMGDRLMATLHFVDAVVLTPTAVPEEVIAALKRHVDDEELLEITTVVAMKCFWNHFASALRVPPEGRCADSDAFRSLCDLSDSLQHRRPQR